MAVRRCGAQPREISDAPSVLVHVPIFATIASLQMPKDAPLGKSSHPMATGSVTDTVPPQPRHVENLEKKIAKRRAELTDAFDADERQIICVLRNYIKVKKVPELIPYDDALYEELNTDYKYSLLVDKIEPMQKSIVNHCAEISILFGKKTPLTTVALNPTYAPVVSDLRKYGQKLANGLADVMLARKAALKKIEKRLAAETSEEESDDDAPPVKKARLSPSSSLPASPASEPAPAAAPEAPASISITMMADMRELTMPAMMQKYGVSVTRLITATKAYLNA